MERANKVRRALAFLLYDPDGFCDRSVLNTLEGFRPHVEKMVVVVNGSLKSDSLVQVAHIADQVLERPNVGFDVGAYREVLTSVGWDTLADFDELLLVNYTFFGPVGSFEPMLTAMAERPVDFWGVTDHPSVTPHPFTGRGTMPAHLQSYWLAIRGTVLRDPAFRDYWVNLPDPTSYSEVVTNFEAKFTEHFSELGYSWEAAYPAANYGVANTTMEAPLALLEDGCPLFKKRLYFHDFPALVEQGVSTGLVTAKAKSLGYPEDLIVEGVVRRASTRELTLGLGANYVRSRQKVTDPQNHDSRITIMFERPWKKLTLDGIDELLGESEFLLVAPHPLEANSRADGVAVRYANALDAVLGDPSFIVDTFDSHQLLAAIYPFMQPVGAAVKGRSWHRDSLVGQQFAIAFDLDGPFTQTTPVAPYRGAAAYRRCLLETVATAVERAGGWEHLEQSAGSEKRLGQIIDILTGDFARTHGYFVGETGTVAEVSNTVSLLTDVLSHSPRVYREYTHYPYSGRVIAPTLKNRIGKKVQSLSPAAFDRLHQVELQMRTTISHLRKGGK